MNEWSYTTSPFMGFSNSLISLCIPVYVYICVRHHLELYTECRRGLRKLYLVNWPTETTKPAQGTLPSDVSGHTSHVLALRRTATVTASSQKHFVAVSTTAGT